MTDKDGKCDDLGSMGYYALTDVSIAPSGVLHYGVLEILADKFAYRGKFPASLNCGVSHPIRYKKAAPPDGDTAFYVRR